MGALFWGLLALSVIGSQCGADAQAPEAPRGLRIDPPPPPVPAAHPYTLRAVPADQQPPRVAFVPLDRVPASQRTYLCTEGPVVYVARMEDRDWHITLDNGRTKLVVEIEPWVPLAVPRKGMTIRVCGLNHHDEWHNWDEIRPFAWCEVGQDCR